MNEARIKELREMAEQAAREAVPCSCIDAFKNRNLTDPQCAYCNYDEQIADAIERVAKEFAERALRTVLHPRHLHAQFAFTSVQQAEGFADGVVAKAISAAERGE